MKHTVIRKKPAKEQLQRLYDGCNRLSEEEIKKLKRDKTNIWL